MLLVLIVLLVAGCSGDDNVSATSETTAGSTSGTEQSGTGSGSSGNSEPSTTTPGEELRTLTINASAGEPVEVQVEIADDNVERYIGLRGRENLPENRGMLFVYGEEQDTLTFTMQDTLIPLSIAFIDSQGRIVDIQKMEPSETGYRSAEPAQYALEVNQGFFEERGVEVGDTVELSA